MESSGALGSGPHVVVPLRTGGVTCGGTGVTIVNGTIGGVVGGGGGGKKMRKRRDLDALLTAKRRPRERPLLVPSTDDQDEPDPHDVAGGGGVKTRTKRGHWWWACFGGGVGCGGGKGCRVWARACKSVLACACFVAACAALWLFADVRVQLASLRHQVELVSAGSKGVPEALQQCHEDTRKLAANQSVLTIKTDSLSEQLANLTSQLAAVQSELDELRSRLKSSPELVKVPQRLTELSTSVAQFGSQIRDLQATVGGLKEQGGRLQAAADVLRANVTAVQTQLSNQSATAAAGGGQRPSAREDDAARLQMLRDIELTRQQLEAANATLANQLVWAADEQKANKVKLDKLLENSVKVDSQIATLLGSQTVNTKKLEALQKTVGNLTKELNEAHSSSKEMALQAKQLQSQINAVVLANDSQNAPKVLKSDDTVAQVKSAPDNPNSTMSSSALAASVIFGPDSAGQADVQADDKNLPPSVSSSPGKGDGSESNGSLRV